MLSAAELKEVSVRLGGARVVHEVSATIARGEWVGLIGPNGAGKTTILRALAGLVPFAGEVALDKRPIGSGARRAIARRVALVPQSPRMPAELTVAEYVLLGRTPHIGYLGNEQRSDRLAAERAIARLGLRPFAEYHYELITADPDPALSDQTPYYTDQVWVTAGLRARAGAGVTLIAGVDVGVASVGFPYGPPLAPWNAFAGASRALPF